MPARDHLAIVVAWQQHVHPDAGPGSVLQRAIDRYREPWRVYHGLSHLIHAVHALHRLVERSPRPPADHGAVVAAVVFHDAVHLPRRDDNEAASAALAHTELASLDGWPPRRCERVAQLVAATAHLAPPPVDRDLVDPLDLAFVLAADLSVLAAEPARYDEYASGVRREYAHVDDAAWTTGRRAVLDAFLARETIFPDLLELDDWERRARANITAEIATLAGGPPDGVRRDG